MTFNEPAVFAFLAHADGIHAPGLRDWPTAIRVADNELRAHASAARRSAPRSRDANIGLAIDVNQVAPATDTERDRVAAERWSSARDCVVPRPAFGRGYPRWDSMRTARRVISMASILPTRRPAIWITSGSTTTAASRSAPGPTTRSIGRSLPRPAPSRPRWTGTSHQTVCATSCSTSSDVRAERIVDHREWRRLPDVVDADGRVRDARPGELPGTSCRCGIRGARGPACR